MRTRAWLVLGVTLFGLTAIGRAEDRPSFRGPGGAGLTTETNLPTAPALSGGTVVVRGANSVYGIKP